MRHLLVVAIALSLACGASEDGTPAQLDAEPEAEAVAEWDQDEQEGQKSEQEGQKKLGFELVWPEDRGPKRNARTDMPACKKQVAEAYPELAKRPSERFRRERDCMEEHGWIYKFL